MASQEYVPKDPDKKVNTDYRTLNKDHILVADSSGRCQVVLIALLGRYAPLS